MAVLFNTPLRAAMLLCELETLKFTDSSRPSSISFMVKDGDSVLFATSYTPDANGSVVVYDMDQILDFLLTTHHRTFTFVAGSAQANVTVFKCSVDIDEQGDTFLSNFFLTPLMAARNTAIGRYEVLYAYCPTKTAVTAIATYLAGTTLSAQSFSLGSITDVESVDCSPAQFELPGKQLLGYSVVCGDRRAEFRVLDLPAADPSLIYLNCFGVWDTIYLSGAKQTAGEYDRQKARIDGKLRSYRIDEVISHRAHTGPLADGTEALAYDLARSRSVFLLDADGVAGDEMIITDCTTEKSNEIDAIPDFVFEYRAANRRTDRISLQRPPRIFDDTFDDSFN